MPRQFYLPYLSGREERGRVPPCNQPYMLESICQGGRLQDGGAYLLPDLIQQGD